VNKKFDKVSAAGLLIALGIIYGDIGTSPLYVLNAILKDKAVTEQLIFGSLSCIIWTLTLQTTIKYVFLTLKQTTGEREVFFPYLRW
jgi:KUP system potassium uptake protein